MKNNRGSIETYRIISRLTKRDILRLSRLTCKKHSHSYLVHPRCALEDGVIQISKDGKSYVLQEKIGFLDIETWTLNFKADMGILLTYCIKELDGKIIKNSITPKECQLKKDNDKRIMKDLIKDLNKFTRLIGHYSTFFDLPFLRTRAVYYNLDFPIYQTIYHSDTYLMLKSKFSLRNRTLRNACKFFNIPAKDHSFEFQLWYNAAKGDKKALDHVLAHNIEDVISTEELWKKINQYSPNSKRSI